ncbi:hypothetical protein MAR_035820 [Mya arenaria]|uniref:Uncharacterized protein n=1 Tax=Mya arenaria TaxID=6604 RepID=A0ABY7EQR3_MYAAR|nr:hypothetical protein MAR_035820 [Mya arenaria]
MEAGAWSEYGNCSSMCGSGHHTRVRTCTDPLPRAGVKVKCSSLPLYIRIASVNRTSHARHYGILTDCNEGILKFSSIGISDGYGPMRYRPMRQDARDTALECLRQIQIDVPRRDQLFLTGCVPQLSGIDKNKRLIRADPDLKVTMGALLRHVIIVCPTSTTSKDGSVLKTHHRVSAIGFFSIDQYEETSHAKYLI